MKVTLNNVKSFIEGNYRYYLYKLINTPQHLKEQYSYRIQVCKDTCVANRKCKYCGCPPIKKAFSNSSCNDGKLFPDLMNEQEWNKYKKENKIEIDG